MKLIEFVTKIRLLIIRIKDLLNFKKFTIILAGFYFDYYIEISNNKYYLLLSSNTDMITASCVKLFGNVIGNCLSCCIFYNHQQYIK